MRTSQILLDEPVPTMDPITIDASYPPIPSPATGLTSASISPSATTDRLAYSRSQSIQSTPAVPPPDTGYAWIFLAAGFLIETLAFGYVFSIGIFHSYWEKTLFPGASASTVITLATTLNGGLMYITAVVIGPVFTRFPQYRPHLQYAGLALSVSGIIASAFATKPWHLVVTAGLMYPLGGCTYYLPAATLLFQWWQSKRGCKPRR